MTGRIIEISNGPACLSIAHSQLVIRREGEDNKTVPVEDLALLLLNHPAIIINQSVMTKLAEANVAIIHCGGGHMPVSISLPLSGHSLQGERLRGQINAPRPLKKQLWKAIIACKIARQADVLALCTGHHQGLGEMAKRVKSGDSGNLEAQAAQRYWPKLLGPSFRRDRLGAYPNGMLNYGYAIMRSAIARNICMSGLNSGIGLFHHNRSNSFPLADDLIEVWRPWVDLRVREIVNKAKTEEFGKPEKQAILSLLNEDVVFEGVNFPVQTAMQRMTSSLAQSFNDGKVSIKFPAFGAMAA